MPRRCGPPEAPDSAARRIRTCNRPITTAQNNVIHSRARCVRSAAHRARHEPAVQDARRRDIRTRYPDVRYQGNDRLRRGLAMASYDVREGRTVDAGATAMPVVRAEVRTFVSSQLLVAVITIATSRRARSPTLHRLDLPLSDRPVRSPAEGTSERDSPLLASMSRLRRCRITPQAHLLSATISRLRIVPVSADRSRPRTWWCSSDPRGSIESAVTSRFRKEGGRSAVSRGCSAHKHGRSRPRRGCSGGVW